METLGKEGEVNVAWDKRSKRYHVRFRHDGRQYDRSTGETGKAAAIRKGAEIFAQIIRGPKEASTLAALEVQISELKTLVLQLVANGTGHKNPNVKVEVKSLEDARLAFAEARKSKHVASSNEDRLQRRIENFVEFTGKNCTLPELKVEHLEIWKDSRPNNGARAQKNDIDAVAQFLRWCGKPPRRWCDPELAKGVELDEVPRFSRLPEVLLPEQAEAMMRLVEGNAPQFVLFYAIALLAGVRANKKDSADDNDGGEIIRLFAAVKRDGWGKYFNGLVLRIPSGKVRGEPRQVHTPENLKAWIRAYPNSLEAPQRAWHTRHVSKPLKLPKNGLRHTAASAYVSSVGDFARAVILFQSAESTLRKHYINLMTREQAESFWKIIPCGAAPIMIAS